MIKVCQYLECDHTAQFLMGWNNKNGKHFGLVCATHDKKLGRLNLVKAGLSTEEAIAFDRYLKETVDSAEYPDFPEWLRKRKTRPKS